MMKVLAAEMSDPTRLRRGKQYAKDGSVLDIIIEPGVVTCEIQGSRSTPYIASIEVRAGDGMPLRRDITTTCTCPDDDNWDGYACKHVVAAMFTLSDELLLEPELLDVWRNRTAATGTAAAGPASNESSAPTPRRRGHLTLVTDEPAVDRPARVADRSRLDPLAEYLRAPAGTALPRIDAFERVEPELPRSRELAAILRDAIGNLRIEWD
jgi:uncharacterized Zn finger protein